MSFLMLFKLCGCSIEKRYFHILGLDSGHWSVRDYVPFRHHIFAPNFNLVELNASTYGI